MSLYDGESWTAPSNWTVPSAPAIGQRNGGQSIADITAKVQDARNRGDAAMAKANEGLLKWHAKRTSYAGTPKEIIQQADMARQAVEGLQQLKQERRASLGRKAAAGAAGAALAGALTLGLMKLLSKKGSDNGGKSRKESRKEIRRTAPMQHKKGGVVKRRHRKKAVKKAVRKAVRKAAGKR